MWMPGNVRTEIHLTGDDTDGAFCLLVDEPPGGWALPEHRHETESETIHVLEGDFEVTIEDETRILGPGESAHVPAGVRHAGRALGEGRGRRLVIFSPAGIEHFFLEVGHSGPDESFDLEAALEAAQRHGWRFGSGSGP